MADLTLRHFEVFRAVIASGGVTAAAKLLHSSQPTLSRELARMEQLLGYALFARQRGRLHPTPRALILYDEVQRVYTGLDQLQRSAERLRDLSVGQVSITCQPAFATNLLPAACTTLSEQHDHAQILITPQESPHLEEALSAQRFDLGLIEHSNAPPGCTVTALLQADEVCVLPQNHVLATHRRLQPKDFAAHKFISLSAADPYRQLIDRMFEQHGIARCLRIETPSADSVCAMVAQGLGIAIVNPLTALAHAERLLIRPLSVSIPYRVSLVKPTHRHDNPWALALGKALRAAALAAMAKLP